MELHEIRNLEGAIIIFGYMVLFFVIKIIINNTLKETPLQRVIRK